ncbi:rhamnogalacturonan acetylesterase [Novosphingobium sp. MW5]|nr:rhamnogalacturonan acetylesterase [Novosphingobium sp. MW5]
MKRIALALATLSAPALAQPAVDVARTEVASPVSPSKIILVGDSTTSVGSGWGSVFCAERVTHAAACLNLARAGRSTSSYRAEGSWAIAMAEAKVPGYRQTFVLIQFGHNDQPGKPGRTTDLRTEFPANLARFVDEVRQAGAMPVLITPLTRRKWKDGKLERDLADYSAAVRQVASERKVPLLDLNARSTAIIEAMGPAVQNLVAGAPAPAEIGAAASIERVTLPSSTGAPVPASSGIAQRTARTGRTFDYTHLGSAGSSLFAAVIADELVRLVPEARPLVSP